jgi:predicted Zn-dependent protease
VGQAVAKHQAGDLQGAIAVLEPLKDRPGVHPAALSLLGSLYLQAARHGEALALLAPLAESDRAGPVILHNAGLAALFLGQVDKAAAYLEKAVAMAPASPASRDLGLLRGGQGRVAESFRLLRPWALAHPEDQEARISAAFGAVELGQPAEAAELLKDLPEDNPRVRLLRGRLRLLHGDPPGALAILEPLLKSAPATLEGEVRRHLAEAHLALGQSSAAIALLQGKVATNPSLALLLARAHNQAGHPADAAAGLEPFSRDLLAKEPAEGDRRFAAQLTLEYGRALVALSRWPDAITALEAATRFAPEDLQAWQLLGRAQLAAGRRQDADRSMEKLRQLQSAQRPPQGG